MTPPSASDTSQREARQPPRRVSHRSAVRAELARFVAIVGVSGAAIAHPVLDAFGESPETFIFHRAERGDLVLFGFGIVVVPPLILWGIGLAATVRWRRGRMSVHAATLGGLITTAVAQALAGRPGTLVAAVAGGVGLAAWVGIVRWHPFHLWAELLSVLPLFSLVTFLTASPASDAMRGGGFDGVDDGGPQAKPVIVVVVDELPTASLLDASGGIDAVRFPNIAAFAQDATWYRNATTVSGFTSSAVPALFTGRYPTGLPPVFTNMPDNIFRLLAGSHDLVVSESITRLCPVSVCGEAPISPTANERPDDVDADMVGLFGEALELWVQRVTGSHQRTDGLDDFEEELSPTGTPPSAFGVGEIPSIVEDAVRDPVVQPTRVRAFIEALRPGDRPLAAILHIVSPHHPWRLLPDGRAYAEPPAASGVTLHWYDDPWIAAVARQLHLLQAMYADALVGQVLAAVREVGVYDDAVIVLVADHGVSFALGGIDRVYSERSAPEIAWVPLLVKAPGQVEPARHDGNVLTVDVMPSAAELAGVDIPWAVDGISMFDETALAARGDTKTFRRFKSPVDPIDATVTFDGAAGFQSMLRLALPSVAPEDDPSRGVYGLSGRGDLLGTAFVSRGSAADGAIGVDDRDRLLASRDPVLVLSGPVADDDATYVVAAHDGTIVAVSPIIQRRDGEAGYVLLLPTGHPVDLGKIRLGLVRNATVLDAGPVG